MKTSRVFTTKLASEEALLEVITFTSMSLTRLEGQSGLGLEDYVDGTIQRVGWWEEGMSIYEAVSPEFREEVLPEDPAYHKFMNTPLINDGETYTFCTVVQEVVGDTTLTYKKLFNDSRLLSTAGLVFPHKSKAELISANEAARRAGLMKYYEERGEALL